MNAHTSMTYESWAASRMMHWEKHIKKALAATKCPVTFEYVAKLVIDREAFLFDNGEAFAIVEVNTYQGQDPFLTIFIAGGDLQQVYEVERTQIYGFARQIGATRMCMITRKGFKNILGKQGWKQPGIYWEKEIPNG